MSYNLIDKEIPSRKTIGDIVLSFFGIIAVVLISLFVFNLIMGISIIAFFS